MEAQHLSPSELRLRREQLRKRLSGHNYAISDGVRRAVTERWGDTWPEKLHETLTRLSTTGSMNFDGSNFKWVITDKFDRVVVNGHGEVIMAVFPAPVEPEQVRARLAAKSVPLSSNVHQLLADRLGDGAVDDAVDRIAAMAADGILTFQTSRDGHKSSWRLASGGDVALTDPQCTSIHKLFWSVMSPPDGVGVDGIRQRLARGDIRCGRRMGWRLKMAWGPNWKQTLGDYMADLADTGEVAEQGDNAYTAFNDDVSLLISRDGDVVVSGWVTVKGDADDIRSRLLAGDLPAHSGLAGVNDSFNRADLTDVMEFFAGRLAQGGAELAKSSTHWRLMLAGVEIGIAADGQSITGWQPRPTDKVDEAQQRVDAGAVWVRSSIAKVLDKEFPDGWDHLFSAPVVAPADRGWKIAASEGDLLLDPSATTVVGWVPPAE